MKILVTGCNGQLGRELKRQAGIRGGLTLIETDVHNLDITDQGAVFALCDRERPEVIINSAAYTNVDGAESDEMNAFKVNALGARNMSVAAQRVGAKIVQVSTDYVFSGTESEPRREYDATGPYCVYGKSKLWGEEMVMKTNPRHFVVRTAWLYGDGKNFVKTMLKLACERDKLTVVNDQTGSPTSTVDLARCILDLIETEHYGLYHGTCEGVCTWYEFAKEIFRLKNVGIAVEPVSSEQFQSAAKRPAYSVLDNFALKMIGMNRFRDWRVSIAEYLEELH